MATSTDAPQLIWGVHLNAHDYVRRGKTALPDGCPPWATPSDIDHWLNRGLVVWDNGAQRIELLSAREALTLLEQLRASPGWRTEGVAVSRRFMHFKFPDEPRQKRTRKKKQLPEPIPSETGVEPTDVEHETLVEERIRLQQGAGMVFFDYLQPHESVLRQMAEQDQRRESEVLKHAYKLILRSAHRRELEKLDLSTRPLPRIRDADDCKVVCDMPPNRATVFLRDDCWFWQGCVERPDRFKQLSPELSKVRRLSSGQRRS